MATHSHIAKKVRCKEELVDAVVEAISEFIENGEKVTLKGIGFIVRKEKEARNGRNPATGESLVIPAKSVVTFKAQKDTVKVLTPVKKAKKK